MASKSTRVLSRQVGETDVSIKIDATDEEGDALAMKIERGDWQGRAPKVAGGEGRDVARWSTLRVLQELRFPPIAQLPSHGFLNVLAIMARGHSGLVLHSVSSCPRQCPVLLCGGSPTEVLLRGPAQGHPCSRYDITAGSLRPRDQIN